METASRMAVSRTVLVVSPRPLEAAVGSCSFIMGGTDASYRASVRLQMKANVRNAIRLPATNPGPSRLASSDISALHRVRQNLGEVSGVPFHSAFPQPGGPGTRRGYGGTYKLGTGA